MCGRYQIKIDIESLIKRYGISNIDFDYNPIEEVFPSNKSPVIILDGNRKVLKNFQWGFPGFKNRLIINARSETAMNKVYFRSSLINRRCLVPANSFFEWDKSKGKSVKKSICIKDYNIFSMAGIYSSFTDNSGNTFNAFTILTTASRGEIRSFHNRMPLILHKEDEDKWIDIKTDSSSVLDLLKPFKGKLTVKTV